MNRLKSWLNNSFKPSTQFPRYIESFIVKLVAPVCEDCNENTVLFDVRNIGKQRLEKCDCCNCFYCLNHLYYSRIEHDSKVYCENCFKNEYGYDDYSISEEHKVKECELCDSIIGIVECEECDGVVCDDHFDFCMDCEDNQNGRDRYCFYCLVFCDICTNALCGDCADSGMTNWDGMVICRECKEEEIKNSFKKSNERIVK